MIVIYALRLLQEGAPSLFNKLALPRVLKTPSQGGVSSGHQGPVTEAGNGELRDS